MIDTKSRTGVFRVVENILFGLLDIEDIDLILFSNIEMLSGSLKYLEFKKELENIQAIFLKEKLEGKEFINKPILRRSKRIIIKFINSFYKFYNYNNGKYDLRILKNSNIFYSPYFPIPEMMQRNSKIKKIITIYDLIPIKYPQYFMKNHIINFKKIIDSIKKDTWVTCISKSTKNDLCNYRGDLNPDRVTVTYLAASDLFYKCDDKQKIIDIKNKYKISEKIKYILSLCTLEPRKNIEMVITSFIKLIKQEKIEDLSLVLTGVYGWNFNRILNEIENYKDIKDRILFTGYIPDEDLFLIYSGALVFVYPSFYEGFGLPPLEAMKCGVPVITSNNSSLPEVVGKSGLMIDASDEDGLCQNILKIYKNPKLQKELSKRSIEQAKKFSWKNCVDKTISVYQMALND
ncbi:MAG: glycosyltransferase family 4 protein [Spirochaetes bacterium]|nr:glycosyltransferase family 4 protein [Spirochaetota bacterium]